MTDVKRIFILVNKEAIAEFTTFTAILEYTIRNYLRHGQSSCIRVRLFRSQCDRIAPSLLEHICITPDRPSAYKYWGTGSKHNQC